MTLAVLFIALYLHIYISIGVYLYSVKKVKIVVLPSFHLVKTKLLNFLSAKCSQFITMKRNNKMKKNRHSVKLIRILKSEKELY
jgi:hypothetical protein